MEKKNIEEVQLQIAELTSRVVPISELSSLELFFFSFRGGRE